ncbi:MAG: hypothetical protein GWP05_00160 [Anaerolineaceae bacterium]|nr:hypothetical protein [Anaerolineaceae bacterium]
MKRFIKFLIRPLKSWLEELAKQHEKDYGPGGVPSCCATKEVGSKKRR